MACINPSFPKPLFSAPLRHHLRRGMALWSMKKDPSLESALSRNRRWIVNNQIKHLLLRSPTRSLPVKFLQKKYKTLDMRGSALNWLNKYPCCFQTFPDPSGETEDLFFGFTKRMAELVEGEEAAIEASEPDMVTRLGKLLSLSRDRRLNVAKLNVLKRSFGFPDDYLFRLVPKRPDLFRVINRYGRHNTMEIELVEWDPQLATSAVELSATKNGQEPHFTCSLPSSWMQSHKRFEEFNSRSPYISPYVSNQMDEEKRTVAMVHELLSLTLWKKLSILKLEHFKREFGLPEQLNRLLLHHPCIFYVSNRYKIYTVVLREGYNGSELVEKDPVVVAKERLGELMQEGLHEYNQRRKVLNLEKKRKRGEIELRKNSQEEINDVAALDKVERREERERFYKVLFDDR
ncbi:Ubiquitin carboxyl-terminal hydrolase family protein [Rhynchospora pubera]|uniref:Ubiquitin carboxyl-terminal hydrolase family protein n=1 Tax=Rhynchospora pubera TaxID=906938 RepID=A0AAV8D7M2_9POAL|nr:Ubiquitin carboxyl-terminal hydrolase family protein [Rhynchospora pubera]